MCKISDKLRLCTCNVSDVENLKHYWILKRPNGQGHSIVGEAILPANIGEEADRLNERIILRHLNKGDCFDVQLQHQDEDILELHFSFKADPEKYFMPPCFGDYLAYAFKFRKGRWKKADFDPFSENLDNIQQGKIDNPFEKV